MANKDKDLKNKPLVEAILEIKWGLTSTPGIPIDPHYKLLIGSLYNLISKEYPEYEPLPSANIPDEMVWQIVQYRYRKGPNDWPLIQIGPGVLAVNDTHKYTWEDFRTRCVNAILKFYEAHPKKENLKIESLLLRYVNAVDLDSGENTLNFLKEKMKVEMILPTDLFIKDIKNWPQNFNWVSSFECTEPKGIIEVRFATGKKEERKAVIWETIVHSKGTDLPTMPEGFESWIHSAHEITDHWFFTLIEGELERRFSGE